MSKNSLGNKMFPTAFARSAILPFQRTGSQQINNVSLVQGSGDCVPCHQEGCDQHRQSRCLEELSSATVIKAVENMLRLL